MAEAGVSDFEDRSYERFLAREIARGRLPNEIGREDFIAGIRAAMEITGRHAAFIKTHESLQQRSIEIQADLIETTGILNSTQQHLRLALEQLGVENGVTPTFS